jgi:hypothetical protein
MPKYPKGQGVLQLSPNNPTQAENEEVFFFLQQIMIYITSK